MGAFEIVSTTNLRFLIVTYHCVFVLILLLDFRTVILMCREESKICASRYHDVALG